MGPAALAERLNLDFHRVCGGGPLRRPAWRLRIGTGWDPSPTCAQNRAQCGSRTRGWAAWSHWYTLKKRPPIKKVEETENQVQDLSPEELAAFREWFAKFGAENWDRQIEDDAKAGKLDRLA